MIVLGVDGGGTKTLAAVADERGVIRGLGRAGASNYQSTSEEDAARAIAEAVDQALAAAGATRAEVAASALGIAGFDGPVEAAIVRRVVDRALGPATRRFVENDALLVLRAGTDAGVGVGVVAGTGNNCIGRARDGRRYQVGGMGPVSGDAGSAPDLAMAAAAAAWRSSDGRAPRGVLLPRLLAAVGCDSVERLPDLMDDGSTFRPTVVPLIVTALFEAADRGDGAALAVIDGAARVLADNAGAALRGLALEGDDAAVVLGGSVFTRYARLGDAVRRDVAGRDVAVHVRTVPAAPVVGALLWAFDQLGETEGIRTAFRQRILASPDLGS